MYFEVDQFLEINNEKYKIIGIIKFRALENFFFWKEYKLLRENDGNEFWLSYDNNYKEYSLSKIVNNVTLEKFHLVDSGTAEVIDFWGDVDVKKGEKVKFSEYEDENEENIISIEQWEDIKEISSGYYLNANQVFLTSNFKSTKSTKNIKIIVGIIIVLFLFFFFINRDKTLTIREYLKKNTSLFTYETSITGDNKEKADIYKSIYNVEKTAKNIIAAIKGEVSHVQENKNEDNSVAILTKDEYCFIYRENNEKKTFVQISNRKFTYTSFHAPYRSSSIAKTFYRNYYFSKAYPDDYKRYNVYFSPYSSYKGKYIATDLIDEYNLYAEGIRYRNNIRQSSNGRRRFSGGGLSSGK